MTAQASCYKWAVPFLAGSSAHDLPMGYYVRYIRLEFIVTRLKGITALRMPKQLSLRTLLAATALVAICSLLVVSWQQSILGRIGYYRSLESHIKGLHTKQPKNLTAAQWGCMVDWTLNLHGNSLIASQTSTSEIAAFESRVNDRLSGKVDASTIDWLWDEYAKVCRGGKNYQRFREMVNESLVALKSPVLLEVPTSPPDGGWQSRAPEDASSAVLKLEIFRAYRVTRRSSTHTVRT